MPRAERKKCCICLKQTSGRWYSTENWEEYITSCFCLSETRIGFLCSRCRNNLATHKKNPNITFPNKPDSMGKVGIHSNSLKVKHGVEMNQCDEGINTT